MGPVFKMVQIGVQNLTLFDFNKNWIYGVLQYAESNHVFRFLIFGPGYQIGPHWGLKGLKLTLFDFIKNWILGVLWYAESNLVFRFWILDHRPHSFGIYYS